MKIFVETEVQYKFNSLPENYQQEAKTLFHCLEPQNSETWENVVNYIWEIANTPPLGFFNYWE